MKDHDNTPAAIEKTPTRRIALKSLAATGGVTLAGAMLPGRWTRPVVDSLVLPAHAQTSRINAATDVQATPIRAQTELRLIKNGGGVFDLALSQLRIEGCSDGDGAVSMSATANMIPSGTINLGTTTTDSMAGTNFLLTLNVPAAVAIRPTDIQNISVQLTIGSITRNYLISQADLIGVTTTPGVHSCTL